MTAQDLQKIANNLRGEVLRMVHLAGAGHVAGPLSSAEILTSLYLGGVTKGDPNNPSWGERDRIVLSAGHYAPLLYAVLAEAGYFSKQLLVKFGKMGSLVGIHPERRVGEVNLPGVEVSSGPLGQGVSVATGMALALKLRYGERPQVDTPKVFCLVSDGELQEGQVWEAFQFAVRRQLDNLIYIVDKNRIQIEHYVSEVTSQGHLSGRMESFGLNTFEVDGHNINELVEIIERAKKSGGAPSIIIAETVAGKGVSFMERNPKWHDKVPLDEELSRALLELQQNDK